MLLRRSAWLQSALVLSILLASSLHAFGQDNDSHRGRKYKAPPATSHIEVVVVKKFNGKPIANAAVVFNPSMNGKDLGNLEVKTDPDGKASIDVIPTGSKVEVQVIASGFATFARDYVIDKSSQSIAVSMLRPEAQISAYEDNEGKPADRKPGVQEPIRPKPTPPASSSPQSSTTPNQ
jgi:hypothetical protein